MQLSQPDFLPLSDMAEILTDQSAQTNEAQQAPVDYNALISDILTEVIMKMVNGGPFPPGVEKKNAVCLKDTLLSYLLASFRRISEEEKCLQKRATLSPMSDMLGFAKTQILQYSSLVLQDAFEQEIPNGIPYSPLLRPILEQRLPGGYLVDLVRHTHSDAGIFHTVK